MTRSSSRRDAIDAQLPNFFKPGTDADGLITQMDDIVAL
jgi:hypothetical protein